MSSIAENQKWFQDPDVLGHMVLFRPLAVFYIRLAQTHSRFTGVLSNFDPRNRI